MVATGPAIGLLANNVVEELTVLEVSGLQLVKGGPTLDRSTDSRRGW